MQTTLTKPVQTGLKEKDREAISEGLFRFLADTYTLYLKTQNYHWNVTGPQFQPLHQVFEDQYKDLADAADLIAERIRALGYLVPATFADFKSLSSIHEASSGIKAEEMVRDLLEGQEILSQTARSLLSSVDKAEDQSTLDLLADRMRAQEKTAWMLRSFLAEE